VLRWGMSDKVGNIDYQQAEEGYLGNGAGGLSISANTKELIENEVKSLIDQGYETAFKIIKKRKKEFERLAQGLLEYETLTGDDIKKIVKGEALTPGDDEDTADKGSAPSVTAIPKTKPKPKPKGGLEPEPAT